MARVGAKRTAFRVPVEKLEGKRPLGRNTRTLDDDIKMDHEEIRRKDVDNTNLAEDRERGGLL
jgi:hypothetical protein